MTLPEIAQARMLADQLAFAVAEHIPRSLALVGCAGEHGLETLVGGPVRRIVGVDINPHYIEATRNRFSKCFSQLELYAQDIENIRSRIAPVELIIAALVLEYVDTACAVASLKNLGLRRKLWVAKWLGAVVSAVPDGMTSMSRPSGSLRSVTMIIKECVNRAYEAPLADGLLFEWQALHAVVSLQDKEEGTAAFVEK
jgi:hypothetical protein